MATTQYIGARYVPIFYTNPDDNSNNWKSGVVYDPLTVVTDLNQSYTSKIPVPASVGRPSENPTYWILTGAYSAQVEQYRQEVAEYADDLTNLGTEVSNIQTDVKSIARVRKYLLIGDSLGLGISVESGSPVTSKGWCGHFIDAVGSDKAVMISINGGGFTEPAPYNWLQQLQNTTFTGFSDDDFTDVIILGGTNDIDDSVASIEIAISNMVTYIKSRFTNVSRIAVGALCEPRLSSRVHERYITACKHGCDYISDLERLLCDTSKYDSTGHTHLSAAGYQFYAPWIIDAALSGTCSYSFTFKSQASVYFPGESSVPHALPYFYYFVTEKRTIVNIAGDTATNATGDLRVRWVYSGTGTSYQGLTKMIEDRGDVCIVMDGASDPPCRTSGIWHNDDNSVTLPFTAAFLGTRYQDHNAIYCSALMTATENVTMVFNSCGQIIVN